MRVLPHISRYPVLPSPSTHGRGWTDTQADDEGRVDWKVEEMLLLLAVAFNFIFSPCNSYLNSQDGWSQERKEVPSLLLSGSLPWVHLVFINVCRLRSSPSQLLRSPWASLFSLPHAPEPLQREVTSLSPKHSRKHPRAPPRASKLSTMMKMVVMCVVQPVQLSPTLAGLFQPHMKCG